MAISQMVGASVKRREDPRLVTGTGSYVDDISQTALVHMHVIRSNEAHARILGIETARAKEADGVIAIFTGKDLKPEFGAPLPVTVCHACRIVQSEPNENADTPSPCEMPA